MRNLIVVYMLFFAVACRADKLFVASNVQASSLDGLEFLLNGRPFTSGKVNHGGVSACGPVSECIKAGTNVLSVTIVEQATDEMRAAAKFKRQDKARIRLDLVRKRDNKPSETISLVDQTFTILPTNFVFTVTDEWPIKKFVWEGETPTLTEKDKAEIKELLEACIEYALNMTDEIDNDFSVRALIIQQEAMLKGMSVSEYRRSQYPKTVKFFSNRYSTRRPENKNISFITFPGINLVHITVDNGQYGTTPLIAYRKDLSGALNGPAWFSKIDGKWCIVP